jgi:hypothetical protein
VDASSSVAPLALPLGNYYWVLPGRVLAGEHPPAAIRSSRRSASRACWRPASAASSI